MTDAANRCWSLLRRAGYPARLAILSGACLVGLAAAAPVAMCFRGGDGLAAAALAMAVCLLAGVLAMGASRPLRRPDSAFVNVLLSMFFRMGVPLGGLIAVQTWGGQLAEGGFAYYLLVFYLGTLAVETALVLPQANSTATPP